MSMQIRPSDKYSFGCRIDGVDVAAGVDDTSYAAIEGALHKHLVVCVSGEPYGHDSLVKFGRRFGNLTINVAKTFHHDRAPEVVVLSNEIINGKAQGSDDAGQIWHTDMSYDRIAGRATLLHAHKVPVKDGKALGDTAFRNMHAAYDQLPETLKQRLAEREAVHEFEWLWTQMLRRGSTRPVFTDAQRREKPPVVHPVFLQHPWTNRKSIYVNRGLTWRILGLSPAESDEALQFLFDFQEKPEFEFRHQWRVGDTLIWDNCASIHVATSGYDQSTPRVMIRVQATGDEALYRAVNGTLGGRAILEGIPA